MKILEKTDKAILKAKKTIVKEDLKIKTKYFKIQRRTERSKRKQLDVVK